MNSLQSNHETLINQCTFQGDSDWSLHNILSVGSQSKRKAFCCKARVNHHQFRNHSRGRDRHKVLLMWSYSLRHHIFLSVQSRLRQITSEAILQSESQCQRSRDIQISISHLCCQRPTEDFTLHAFFWRVNCDIFKVKDLDVVIMKFNGELGKSAT